MVMVLAALGAILGVFKRKPLRPARLLTRSHRGPMGSQHWLPMTVLIPMRTTPAPRKSDWEG